MYLRRVSDIAMINPRVLKSSSAPHNGITRRVKANSPRHIRPRIYGARALIYLTSVRESERERRIGGGGGGEKESMANRRSPDNTSARQLIYASAGIKYDADGERRDCNCSRSFRVRRAFSEQISGRAGDVRYIYIYSTVEPAINWTSGRRCKKVGQTPAGVAAFRMRGRKRRGELISRVLREQRDDVPYVQCPIKYHTRSSKMWILENVRTNIFRGKNHELPVGLFLSFFI